MDDDTAILNPRDLFAKAVDVTESDINAADYAFWQVEIPISSSDPLIAYAEEVLHGTVQQYRVRTHEPGEQQPVSQVNLLYFRIDYALKQAALRDKTQYDDSLRAILGILERGLLTNTPTDEQRETALVQAISDELKQNRIVFPGCEREVAAMLLTRAKQVFAHEPISDPVEAAACQNASLQAEPNPTLYVVPKPDPQLKSKSRHVDLNALPDDEPGTLLTLVSPTPAGEPARQQMKLFG